MAWVGEPGPRAPAGPWRQIWDLWTRSRRRRPCCAEDPGDSPRGQGQDRPGAAQQHADGLLRNLGALVYAERTGRAAPDTQDQMTKLIAEISAHEAENGINLSDQPTRWTAVAQGAPPQGPGSAGPAGPGRRAVLWPGTSSFPQGNPSFPTSGGSTSFPDSGGTGSSALPAGPGPAQAGGSADGPGSPGGTGPSRVPATPARGCRRPDRPRPGRCRAG